MLNMKKQETGLRVHLTIKSTNGSSIHLIGTPRIEWRVVECRPDDTIKSSMVFRRKSDAMKQFNHRKSLYKPMPQDVFPKENIPLKRWRRNSSFRKY